VFPLSSMLSKDSQTSLLLLVAPAAAAAAAAPSSAPAWRLAPERAAGAHASQVREERERERDTRSSLDKESSRFCEETLAPQLDTSLIFPTRFPPFLLLTLDLDATSSSPSDSFFLCYRYVLCVFASVKKWTNQKKKSSLRAQKGAGGVTRGVGNSLSWAPPLFELQISLPLPLSLCLSLSTAKKSTGTGRGKLKGIGKRRQA
jgi:hypothetical protein